MRIVQGDAFSTGAIIGAVALMVGVGGFLVLVPNPTAGATPARQVQQKAKLQKNIASLTAEYERLKTAPVPHLFTTTVEEAAPQALERLNALAKGAHVVINGFRPQKEQTVGDFQLLPYFMTLQGSFDGISKFLDDLSSKEPKLAVTLIQIAAPESGGAQVTASVNVVGYLKPGYVANSDDTSGQTAQGAPKLGSMTKPELGGHSVTVAEANKTVTEVAVKPSESMVDVSSSTKATSSSGKAQPGLKPNSVIQDKKEKQNG